MEENNQSLETNTQKRDETINKFIRRMAVIKSKFPEFSNAPKSIQDEYFTLNRLVDSLQSSRRGIWGPTIASDGCEIDKFVKEKYESALAQLDELSQENLSYITYEEDANFKFPEIDFEGLRQRIDSMTKDDYSSLYSELTRMMQQPFPEETTNKLHDMLKDLLSKSVELNKTTPMPEAKIVVTESKFAQIYGKARGKIKEVFSKIKSLFKQKSHDKDEHTEDLDNRE